MSLSDPIADLLTRIRNACLRKHRVVSIPFSTIKKNIAEMLFNEGFIISFKIVKKQTTKLQQKEQNFIEIELKYNKNKESVIRKIKRISRPGLRIYKGSSELLPQLGGQGVLIISTSEGLLSDAKCRLKGIGGEVLCLVY